MLEFPEKVKLAQLNTPVVALKRLSETYGGPEILLKRDDLTGVELSGNKVRKLEYVLAEALQQKKAGIVTCGGIQSNHARASAAACAKLGLKCHLLLRGKEPDAYRGNLFLDLMFGASYEWITPEQYRDERRTLLEQAGEKMNLLPVEEGASMPTGVWGYIEAARELQNVETDAIICAIGSGGTLTGLLIGKKVFSLKADILAVNVCDDADYFKKRVSNLSKQFSEKYNLDFQLEEDEIKIIDGYVGEGYALHNDEQRAVAIEAAKLEGIIFDPVYTGKMLWGVKSEIAKGNFKKYKRITLLHTGGIFGALADSAQYSFRK